MKKVLMSLLLAVCLVTGVMPQMAVGIAGEYG